MENEVKLQVETQATQPVNLNNQPAPTPAPYAAGTGSAQLLPGREAISRMSYRERLTLKRSDPEGYKTLRGE